MCRFGGFARWVGRSVSTVRRFEECGRRAIAHRWLSSGRQYGLRRYDTILGDDLARSMS
jgi:hypothetical protein